MRTTAVPAARAILQAAGLPEATAGPAGHLASPGYFVIPLQALGPDRAAVRWCRPGLPASSSPAPSSGLARCQAALHAAGCRCEFVITTNGGYLAVLAPASDQQETATQETASATKGKQLAAYAVSVSIDDLALVLWHIHATRLSGPHAQPAAQTISDAIAAYHRLKAAIARQARTRSQP